MDTIIDFIMVYGARVTCKVIEVHYRRSPLIQGGGDSIKVTVEMLVSENNNYTSN